MRRIPTSNHRQAQPDLPRYPADESPRRVNIFRQVHQNQTALKGGPHDEL
jgi:hypothetical protein